MFGGTELQNIWHWQWIKHLSSGVRSSPPEVFLGKCVLKICSKFTGEHPWRSVISVTPRHRYSPVNLPHIFRTAFPKNISGGLLNSQSVSLKKRRDRKFMEDFCLQTSFLSKKNVENSISHYIVTGKVARSVDWAKVFD